MRATKTILGITAFLAVIPNAHAASKVRSCFETEQAVNQFVENLDARETAFHEDQKRLRELVETPGLTYNALTFIFQDKLKLDDQASSSGLGMTYQSGHYHLKSGDIEPGTNGERYCVDVWSKSYMYVYRWTVDPKQNKILTTNISTEVTW